MIDYIGIRFHATAAAPNHRGGRHTWTAAAECAGEDVDVFFPEKGDGAGDAKRICDRCPVRPECLAFAMEAEHVRGYRSGIFGGLTAKDRSGLARRGWRRGDPVPPVRFGNHGRAA